MLHLEKIITFILMNYSDAESFKYQAEKNEFLVR